MSREWGSFQEEGVREWDGIQESLAPETPQSSAVGQHGHLGENATVAAFSGKYAKVVLVDESGNLLTNLTGIQALWFDSVPTAWTANQTSKKAATGRTTDANGKFSWDVGPETALNNGENGTLVIIASDGTPNQSPAARQRVYVTTLSATP